jgi:hypothetical protein
MRVTTRVALFALATAAALAGLSPGAVSAQVGGIYDLRWNTFDGGGATFSTGGIYSLGATIGQPDAGLMSGGVLTLAGGFWQGGMTVTAVDPEDPGTPDETVAAAGLPFRLHPAAPNPSRAQARIAFDLPAAGTVLLAVYDLQGARIRTLVDGALPAGRNSFVWEGGDDDGHPIASGTYIVRLRAGPWVDQEKVVVIK